MRVLVWQWGHRGAGPRFAALLAAAFRELPGTEAGLALPSRAEILSHSGGPNCVFLLPSYRGPAGLALRLLVAPGLLAALMRQIRAFAPTVAICAMPSPLDLLMWAALRATRVPVAVIVHDAEAHPGDGYPLQYRLQWSLIRRADAIIALSGHVADRLRVLGLGSRKALLLRARLPPFAIADVSSRPDYADGRIRVLSFGRLRAYKGLDLLLQALRLMGPRDDMVLRVVGRGEESSALRELRTLPGVTVENRWVPESELGHLIGWADLLLLPYREAIQSGVAAMALAAGRRVLSTRVGGLIEQLGEEPLARLCEPEPAALVAALADMLSEIRAAGPEAKAGAPDTKAAWCAFAAKLLAGLGGLKPGSTWPDAESGGSR